ncbi:bacteriocin-protection, YdeI or OmpD-associated-domain-containing protein [Pyrenochaeta sp. MPI-SDFR-AT-0127]|nr:bacteriocin-protection, YdeI or OmpD-associated-domain-containing protein [Pyrenochaeta sp. MPI-SDFR-AT-0127]
MAPKPPPSDLPTQVFPTSADFETFLKREHNTAPGVYLKMAKKNSGIPSISGAEAVEIALCYGWIDGRANAIDENWWTVRYTPRRAKSIWSQKNVNTVARLVEQGRMHPAGVAAVDAAKADGRWDRAYAGPATIEIPDDLKSALAEEPAADAFWKSLNKSDRFATLHRLQTASDTVRPKRMAAFVQMLAAGQQPGAPSATTKTKPKPKRKAGIKKATETAVGTTSALQSDVPKPPRRAGLRQRRS